MSLFCPHCHSPIERTDSLTDEILCPACGSSFRLETSSTTDWAPKDGQKVGKYELLGAVGHGAFGTVYQARDPELDRVVAVKVPRAGHLAGPYELDRFLREARSAAQLRHPSIVSVHEVGQHNGIPFLVSDFVRGLTLADLLSARRPSFHESARLLAALADALQYAHERGVVHRDVKPSNVMLGEDGTPLVMDFGLAKREAGDITMTVDGQVLGTPAYMSPEQARGESHRVDGRSDVYSLGVILYQLLTGELPFRGTTRMLLHQVLHDDPRPPRSLNDSVPRDLETVCLKAMAREPARRYQSAADLASDLRRFLAGEPIKARPAGRVERALKWVKRRPALAALLVVSVLALAALAGAAVALFYNNRLEGANARLESALHGEAEQRGKAEEQRALARRYLYYGQMNLAEQAVLQGNVKRALQLLEGQEPAQLDGEDLRGFEWHYLRRLSHREVATFSAGGVVSCLVVSADGRRIVTGGQGKIILWDSATRQPLATFLEAGKRALVLSLALSPDSKYLAATLDGNQLHLWEVSTGAKVAERLAPRLPKAGRCVAFSPDSKRLAVADSFGNVRCVDLDPPQEGMPFPRGPFMYGVGFQEGPVRGLVFSADGGRLAIGARMSVIVFDTRTGQRLFAGGGQRGQLHGVDLSPDGKLVAAAASDGIRVWDVDTGTQKAVLQEHAEEVCKAVFSPDPLDASRPLLASASKDRTVRVWDVSTGKSVLILVGHTRSVWDVAFLPHGNRLVSASVDGTVKIWEGEPAEFAVVCRTCGPWLPGPVFHRGVGRARRADGAVEVCDPVSGQMTFRARSRLAAPSFTLSPGGTRLAAAQPGRPVEMWDLETGEPLPALQGPSLARSANLVFGEDGRLLANVSAEGVEVWDVATGQVVATYPGEAEFVGGPLRLSADGKRLARAWGGTLDGHGTVKVWDLPGRRLLITLPADTVAFSPDGRYMAAGFRGGMVKVWDGPLRGDGRALRGHTDTVSGLAFTPTRAGRGQGVRLASACRDGTVKLWDPETGMEALTLVWRTGAGIESTTQLVVAFSPDGRQLACVSREGMKVWEAGEPGSRDLRLRQAELDWHLRAAAACEEVRDWAGAVASWTYLIGQRPDRASHYVRRGMALAELGQDRQAAADFEEACRKDPDDVRAWTRGALLGLRAGDRKAHQAACADLLKRFGQSGDAHTLGAVAWGCSLLPDTGADRGESLRLAERAVARGKGEPALLRALGAALYRADRPGEAAQRLREAMQGEGRGGTPWDWLLLALAQRKLGEHREAEVWLKRAKAYLAAPPGFRPGEKFVPGQLRWQEWLRWDDRLELTLLQAEAEALGKGAP